MTGHGRLDRLRRRWFGRHILVDPRPIADDAPYTFLLPSENERLALGKGDLAKLIFVSDPPSDAWEAERMWVEIVALRRGKLIGVLLDEPYDMPHLRPGTRIAFDRDDVIDLEWAEDRAVPPPRAPAHRRYWDRCLVDACVLTGDARVQYLYREDPDAAVEGDTVDSGWRIRGDYRDCDDDAVETREVCFVAIGAVLNHDDSWLPLIDAPVGSAFLRDWDTGRFVATVMED